MLVYLVETAVNTGLIFFPLLIIGIVGWYYVFSITLFLWKERRLHVGNGEELSAWHGFLILLQSDGVLSKEKNLAFLETLPVVAQALKRGAKDKPGVGIKNATKKDVKHGSVTFKGLTFSSMEVTLDAYCSLLDAKKTVDLRNKFSLYMLSSVKKAIATVHILAGVAPLLGLLGTVAGMIDTFEVISVYGNANPTLLAQGISKALLTTQFGLVVALPLLLASLSMGSKVNKLGRWLRKT